MLNDLGTNSTTFLSPSIMVKDELHQATRSSRLTSTSRAVTSLGLCSVLKACHDKLLQHSPP